MTRELFWFCCASLLFVISYVFHLLFKKEDKKEYIVVKKYTYDFLRNAFMYFGFSIVVLLTIHILFKYSMYFESMFK